MLFRALAADYDGTLASHDRLEDGTVAALESARRAGLRLILVTGRTFFELTRVCERLDLFDAVVAENGAVLHYPGDGTIFDEAPGPPPRLLVELDRRAIPYQVGRVIVGTARSYEADVRSAMEAVDIQLDVVSNRAALMLLPSGISKGTGIRRAIQQLHLSFHDVLALGDAENDLELFAACGFAACPGSAVADVQNVTDWVFSGENGSAIASAITEAILGGTLPPARSARERIHLGRTRATVAPVTIPAHGVNVLVQGDSLSGKSWLAGGLIERLAARRYATCVIDPEGDYQTLADVPGVTSWEFGPRTDWADAVALFERDPGTTLVVDLSALPREAKLATIGEGLAAMGRLRARTGLPHWIFLDEAHYLLHAEGIADEVAGLDDKGFCLITYQASRLRESVLDVMDVLVLARTSVAAELAFLRSSLAHRLESASVIVELLRDLAPPEFVVLMDDAEMPLRVVPFEAPPRLTSHVRHLGKYVDQPVAPDRAFVFRFPDGRWAATADTLQSFQHRLKDVDVEVLVFHASRGDFSRWLADVFLDRQLSAQVRVIEHRLRRGDDLALRAALVRVMSVAIEET